MADFNDIELMICVASRLLDLAEELHRGPLDEDEDIPF